MRGRHFIVIFAVTGVLFLGACGGSDPSSSSDTSVDAGETSVGETSKDDDTAAIAAFCVATNASNELLPQIEETDNAAAVTTKVGALAASLTATAEKAPSTIKKDADTIAAAATAMADAMKSDPSLESFDAVVSKYATAEVDAATAAVNKFVTEKCGESK